jgi:hypothetical protein
LDSFRQEKPSITAVLVSLTPKAFKNMVCFTNLDAVKFFHQGKGHVRVYYLFDDEKTIKESCYRQDYGWFVIGDGVVAKDAKANSPIAVTNLVRPEGNM